MKIKSLLSDRSKKYQYKIRAVRQQVTGVSTDLPDRRTACNIRFVKEYAKERRKKGLSKVVRSLAKIA
ncbi:MAG: hypothetical protein Q4A75_08500 [Peptostreptococcaceae bacterium]|nr:hypothetical protein [Peptostreptococcaceae bacterium]